MAHLIQASSSIDAWKHCSQRILDAERHELDNLVVEITSSESMQEQALWAKACNPKKFHRTGDCTRHVANTLFPLGLYDACEKDRPSFYSYYERIFNAAKNKSWGTYFQRMISFGKGFHDGQVNQLENVIGALKGGSPQRHFIHVHTTGAHIESNVRPMGAPCWQYGEFTRSRIAGQVDLVAVYRNQDYFNKAFGNFIGLIRLLDFVCANSGKSRGKLIVHAVHAYTENASAHGRMLSSIS